MENLWLCFHSILHKYHNEKNKFSKWLFCKSFNSIGNLMRMLWYLAFDISLNVVECIVFLCTKRCIYVHSMMMITTYWSFINNIKGSILAHNIVIRMHTFWHIMCNYIVYTVCSSQFMELFTLAIIFTFIMDKQFSMYFLMLM